MNILVTGGAGYIGSHMVRRLLQAGHQPVVLDDLSHGHAPAVRAAAAEINTQVPLIQCNTGDPDKVIRTIREYRINAVMHFAAFIEVAESVRDPGKYYRNNFSSALTLLEALRATGVERFVFSSTAAVYGNPHEIPITEDHERAPINPYGRSKWMVETALEDFAAAHGLGYAILRYFNVAGASADGCLGERHEPETHLIPRILTAAAGASDSIEIFGTDYPTPDGTCVRDYVHVEDLADAHLLALEAIEPGHGSAFNLGSENGFSVREVIAACERVTKRDIPVTEKPRRPGDPAILIASSAKIRSHLGWRRRHPDLDTIVRHAWQWHCNPRFACWQ